MRRIAVLALCAFVGLGLIALAGPAGVRASSPGDLLWSKHFGNDIHQDASSTAIDGSGNIVVVGSFFGTVDLGGGSLTSAGQSDVFLAKFDSAGNHLWSKRFGDADYQFANAVAVDSTGSMIVTGQLSGTADFGGGPLTSAGDADIFLAKFDGSGALIWSKRFGEAEDQFGNGVAVDGLDNIVVTGYLAGTVDFGGGPLTSSVRSDVFLAKFDSTGNHVWSKRFGDANYQTGSGVAVDGSGSVVLTAVGYGSVDFGGGLLTSAVKDDVFLAKFDSSGDHLWSKRFGDENYQEGAGVAVDRAGNVVITGYFSGTVDFGGGPLTSAVNSDYISDIFVAEFGSSGNYLWSKRFGDADDQLALGVAVDRALNVVVTGGFAGSVDFGGGPLASGSSNSYDMFVAEFDNAGNLRWSTRFGNLNSDEFGTNVAVDGAFNVIVVGRGIFVGKFASLSYSTPTGTPTPPLGVVKVPAGNANNADPSVPAANLYLCYSGPCSGPGEGDLRVVEHASNVQTADQDGNTVPDGLGAYEFSVEYDNFVLASVNPCDIVFGPTGAGAARGPVDELNTSAINPDCTPDPNGGNGSCSFSLILENVIHFACATNGQVQGPLGDMDLASLDLIPSGDLVNDIFPGNDNGVLTVIKDTGCELSDIFGHPALGSVNGGLTPVCGDLAVTVRILEGDLNLDCKVDLLDEAAMAYRYGSFFGSALYSKWYDLEPALHDLDIDIKDIQKVFGRDGSTCQNPVPPQPPLPPPAPFIQ